MDDIEIEVEAEESTEKSQRKKTVSFSQYAMWLKCPHQWKLSYIENRRTFTENIHTVFGTAVHTTVQLFLKTLYEVGAIEAEKLECVQTFNDEYEKELNKVVDKGAVISSEDIESFRKDGVNIIEYFTSHSNRTKHFPSRIFEVVGVELPLVIPIRNGAIVYKGYLDIVLKEKSTGKIRILDFKTSTYGWNKWQKADRTKIDQLLLYKRFYHQFFKVPMADIEVEFIILKRKLYEDVAFPQQRIQRIVPLTGKLGMKNVEESFVDFINNCFDQDGEYNIKEHFFKNPGKAKKNCKYCPFKDMVDENEKAVCDGKEG